MPWPKGQSPSQDHREKLRSAALTAGSGKWMRGRTLEPDRLKKLQAGAAKLLDDPQERLRRSERARAQRVKDKETGRDPFTAEARAKARVTLRGRKGQSYKTLYGDRADAEKLKRKAGNDRRFVGHEKNESTRTEAHLHTFEYRQWRTAVFYRDNYTCQRCFTRGGQLHAHHVKSWADYPTLRFEVSNGLTLHERCHRALHKETPK
jgi:5-methylcytosine-specific restriction endonuclease McrA